MNRLNKMSIKCLLFSLQPKVVYILKIDFLYKTVNQTSFKILLIIKDSCVTLLYNYSIYSIFLLLLDKIKKYSTLQGITPIVKINRLYCAHCIQLHNSILHEQQQSCLGCFNVHFRVVISRDAVSYKIWNMDNKYHIFDVASCQHCPRQLSSLQKCHFMLTYCYFLWHVSTLSRPNRAAPVPKCKSQLGTYFLIPPVNSCRDILFSPST